MLQFGNVEYETFIQSTDGLFWNYPASFLQRRCARSRRHCLSRPITAKLVRCFPAGRGRRPRWVSKLPTQGQTGDLLVPKRGTIADGSARLQTAIKQIERGTTP